MDESPGVAEEHEEADGAEETLLTSAKASGPIAAAISHHASSSVPKYSATPVIRCTIDITMLMSGL